ncbi:MULTISPECIES: hypothetical protein [unclassified Sporosarcina]|uniref:hypothetical protein n=1 Tax=unclassified Sporosarcina TaxID=2647733 RepID=UPI0016463FC7|nr:MULTISPECIES: hypothetical protein [unclassified Sporosarcina]MBO0589612.1 hypothetical protein [Sporosarcina sp. E16_8]MBO0603521.1 hypothetical protein [Sporosarcina sp. E16_3]
MKRKTFYSTALAFGVIGVSFFAGNVMLETSAEENIAEEVKVPNVEVPMVVTLEDLAPVKFNSVDESEVKMPLNLEEKNIDHIVGEARGVNAEKRPGGYLIETWYPTDTENGDLLVAQSINEYGVAQSLVEDVKTWYPEELGGFKELNLGGYQAILNENEEDANTLHIITDNEIFTIAGQKTEILLDVAEEMIKDLQ